MRVVLPPRVRVSLRGKRAGGLLHVSLCRHAVLRAAFGIREVGFMLAVLVFESGCHTARDF